MILKSLCSVTETKHKGYALFDSIYVASGKKQNRGAQEPISGCQGLEVEEAD